MRKITTVFLRENGCINVNEKILITCPKKLSPWLAAEVRSLGFTDLREGDAFVETTGDFADAMRLNLHVRTGHRVLYRIASFAAKNPDDLYQRVRGIPWEKILYEHGEHAYLCVTSTVDTPSIRDSRFVNQRAKDAIVDRIGERRGKRPDSGAKRDRAVVYIYWRGYDVEVYLDTSGEPLSRRGYRRIPLEAPMQETLAAAVVLATGWDGKACFVNPMCGSGTLAIEAALYASRTAPGLLRKNFGFYHLRGFDAAAWRKLKLNARAAEHKSTARIIATDISPDAIAAARQNAKMAGVEGMIEFYLCPFADTPIPEQAGVIVVNPPYGERTGDVDELGNLYKEIGDFFKQRGKGHTGFIFTGNLQLAKRIGLRTSRRIPFYNGSIECRLLEYPLY